MGTGSGTGREPRGWGEDRGGPATATGELGARAASRPHASPVPSFAREGGSPAATRGCEAAGVTFSAASDFPLHVQRWRRRRRFAFRRRKQNYHRSARGAAPAFIALPLRSPQPRAAPPRARPAAWRPQRHLRAPRAEAALGPGGVVLFPSDSQDACSYFEMCVDDYEPLLGLEALGGC